MHATTCPAALHDHACLQHGLAADVRRCSISTAQLTCPARQSWRCARVHLWPDVMGWCRKHATAQAKREAKQAAKAAAREAAFVPPSASKARLPSCFCCGVTLACSKDGMLRPDGCRHSRPLWRSLQAMPSRRLPSSSRSSKQARDACSLVRAELLKCSRPHCLVVLQARSRRQRTNKLLLPASIWLDASLCECSYSF